MILFSEMNRNFASILKELRAEKGVSCMTLGKAIGVSNTAVNSWELGKNSPKVEEIIKLSKYFGVTANYLLGLEE